LKIEFDVLAGEKPRKALIGHTAEGRAVIVMMGITRRNLAERGVGHARRHQALLGEVGALP